MSSASDYGQQFMDLAFQWGQQRLAERRPPAGAVQNVPPTPRVIGNQMSNAPLNSDQSTPAALSASNFDFKNPMVIVGTILAAGLLFVLLKR